MKKIISVITLIVMMGVNIMDPFTYAISLGDDFAEIQEIDEIVVESGDFDENEEDETDENQDDEENTDINEENETDEDSELDEDSDEETDEDIDDETEVGSGTQVEIDENEIEELTGDIEILSGDSLEFTGEMLELTEDNLEITGEVIELTGKALELSLARETLNTNTIIGTEKTKGVTVNVEAQAGTFPQGTELRIKPITLKNELNEIKEQIIDSHENVSEDSELVAFDITFIYVLSGGEEVEVQPNSGEGVKVTFDYTDNEKLSEADNNEEQEIKVFHIDDKDEKGEKVAQGEEIVKEVTNKVESEEVGIAVANAESFSVYAVVATSGNGLSVTYDPNGGYWIEDHDTNPKTVIYTGTKTTMLYRTPSKTGFMFMGWYDETLTNRRKDGVVTDGMTVYAKWQEFGDLDVYFLKSDSVKFQYTFMDRNLGAIGIYNNNYNAPNINSFGYYYQRGNNHGFDSKVENEGILNNISENTVDVSSYSWDNPYGSYLFIGGKNWMTSKNTNLWGGDESDVSHRQGPCPDGYHIPNVDEWRGVVTNYTNARNGGKALTRYLLLPAAGYRDRGFGTVGSINGNGNYLYASSSLNGIGIGDRILYVLVSVGDGDVNVSTSTNNNPKHEWSSNGVSVRCKKNEINTGLYTIDINNIDLNGGEKAIISILSSGEVVSLQEPTKGDEIFGGFYTNEDYLGEPIKNIGDIIPEGTTHLYAKWDCPKGQVEDQGICVPGFKILFNAINNGGTTTAEDIVVTGSSVSKTINLADYTAEKSGYYFVGWNTNSGADVGLQGIQTFTQNTTLYAIFLNLYAYTFLDEDGEVLGTGYYQSGVVSDMGRLIPLEYYTNGKVVDTSSYPELLTLGLDDPSKGWKWVPSLPEDGIATGDLILHGEKLNKYTVTFKNNDSTDFLSYDVVDGTIIKEPATHPEILGYTFLGWYEDEELTAKFNFSSKVITQNTIIYPAFKEILCTFVTGTVGTGISINGFSGTQTEDCLTHFVIPSEIDGKPVLRIGDNAFNGDKANAQIISGEIILPDTLTSIGSSSFYNNNISGTLRIPGGITTVGGSFKCNLVEEVIFGEGITTINQDAFRPNNCTTKKTLKKVTFPSTLETIGTNAFNGQIIEGELELPENLTSIGGGAFDGNNISGTLKIPGGVTTVTSAFKCNLVEEVIFGEGITTISNEAFRTNGCTTKKTLKKVTFPSTLETIGTNAFDGQIIEGELELPENLTSIGGGAFNNNNISGTLKIPGGVTTVTSAFKCNLVEEVIFGEGITTISNEAFRTNGCITKKTLKKVTFPSTLETIGNSVFDNQIIEGEVIIPDSVETIGSSAFNSNQITGLILGNSVQTIGNSAFNNNNLTGELIIPGSVQTIGNYAFDGNNGGNKIGGELIIPDSVQTIGEYAFRKNQIIGLILGNSVQTIGNNAFESNQITGELIIPNSVISIGNNAFYNNNISGTLRIPGGINNGVVNEAFRCNQIEEVVFGEGIISINKEAFSASNCIAKGTIKKVTFPSTLESIGDSAFWNQIIEGEFTFPPSLTTLGTAVFRGNNISGTLVVPGRLNGGRLNGAFRCNLIENVIIEEGITVVGGGAFHDGNTDCPKSKHTLKSVQFPSSLTGIEVNAFRNNQLTGLIIGENVETIGDHAFDNQYNESGYTLKSVILNDKLQNIGYRTFATNDIKSVYIPDSVSNLSGQVFDQLASNRQTYVTGYVTTKKSTLDYTGAFIKPLYQLYTYTFVDEDGDILGTGYYPEILASNTTKLIPLDYYNGIGNVEDFVDVDSLISHELGYKVVWSTPLSESSVVTESLVVTGSVEKVYTVTFKNPFTGDIVEYVENNGRVNEPEEFVVEGHIFTGWYSGDTKVEFPLIVISDLVLTGRYDINKYTLSLYSDKENPQLLSGIVYYYNTTIDIQPIENPTKPDYDFVGWKNVTGDADVVFPLTITGDLDIYAIWEDPMSELTGWDGCYQYKTYTGEVEETVQYYAEITAYSGAESCSRENLTMPNIITRNGRSYDVKKIGDYAFDNEGLSGSLTIPGTIEKIGVGAFRKNPNITSLNLNEGLKVIDSGVFDGISVESLIIPDTVTIINNGAFWNNPNLKNIKIGKGLKVLNNVFSGSTLSIKSLDLGEIESIYDYLSNTQITDLVIPDTVTTISPGAFYNNTKLKTVKIGTGLKTLNPGVFGGSSNIESIDLGALESIGVGNFDSAQITGLVIPATVTNIDSNAFINNTKLERVIFTGESQIQSIGAGAFSYSALTGVSLPNSLTTLGKGVFCADDGTNTGTVIGFIGDDPSVSAETLESQDDTACFVIKNSAYQVNIALTGENMGDFAQDSERSGSKNYGKRIVVKVVPRHGYRFWKWEVDGIPVMTGEFENEYWTGDLELVVTSGMYITGFFTGDINTYAVHHRKENLDGEYSGEDMISLTGYGITDELTNAVALDFPGFTGKAFDQTGIKADGSTVVDIFYDRELYTITFDSASGSAVTGITEKYEKRITKPEDPKRDGYEFNGWYYDSGELCEFPIPMPLNGVNLTAQWTVNTGTQYKVEYYLQNEDLENYDFYLTGMQYGTSDTQGVAEMKHFTGFEFNATHAGNIISGIIAGDGSLILKLFYDRKAYTISTGSNDESQGSISVEGEPRYGKRIIFRSNIHDSSLYKFVKWELNGHFVTTGENNEFWTGDLVIENLTGDVIVTGHFVAFERCELPWGGSVVHGTSITGYKTESETCPGECEGVSARCNNGEWSIPNFTGTYVKSSCTTNPVEIPVEYTLNECPLHGNCSLITGYTVSENVCVKGEEKYRLDSCETHYHKTGDNKLCEIDSFEITWSYKDEAGNETGDTTRVEYGVVPTHADPADYQTARTGYTFANWTPELTGARESTGYTAVYNETAREYTVSTGTNDNEQGSVTVETIAPYTYGKKITFKAHPKALHKLIRWEVNGEVYLSGGVVWTGDLEIELTGNLNVTGHFAAYSGCKWDGGIIAHGTSVTGYEAPEVEFGGTCKYEIRTCNDGTLSGSYEYTGCEPAAPSSCELPWGGYAAHGISVTGYTTESETCPGECEGVSATCNNGEWSIPSFTGTYVKSSCITNSVVIPEDYILDVCPLHGNCSSITGYIVSENACVTGNVKVRLDSCEVHYHTGLDNKSCEIDKFHIVWNYRDDNGEQTGETINIEYGKPVQMPSYPTIIQTAQTGYTFIGWNPEVISPVTTGAEYTAQYDEETRSYEITWKYRTETGIQIETGNYVYGTMPSHAGNNYQTAQTGYTFNGWKPEIMSVTGPATYEAEYNETARKYDIIWRYRDENGARIEEIRKVEYGKNPEVPTLPSTSQTAQTGYTFTGWNPEISSPVTTGAEYTAQYEETLRTYLIAWQDYDGSMISWSLYNYGDRLIIPADPTRPEDENNIYEFIGWSPNVSEFVTGNRFYKAQYEAHSKKTPSGGGGSSSGGGGRRIPDISDKDIDGIIKDITDDEGSKIHGSAEENNAENREIQVPLITTQNMKKYSKQVIDSYIWAFDNNITTINEFDKANPDGTITRGLLAKVVVNYIENVLGKEIPLDTSTQCNWEDDIKEWKSEEIKFYAEKACALGVMGIKTKKFEPNKIVSRAEFGTILSRILWGNKYDVKNPTRKNWYYTNHLKVLQENGIMNDIDNPLGRNELRKWIWVMLRRTEVLNRKRVGI